MKLKSKIMLGSGLPLLLIVALCVIITAGVNLLLESTKWVDHTHIVIGEARGILAAAVDMETGARGFLLAGEEQFLDPYKNGQKIFASKLTALKKTVSDNPAQVKLLGEVSQTITNWREKAIEPALELRRRVGNAKTMDNEADSDGEVSMTDITALIRQEKGKVYFDEFRTQIGLFIEREQKLMKQRQEEAEGIGKRTLNLTVFGTLTTILTTLIISFITSLRIVKPVNSMSDALKDISQGDGDLTARIHVSPSFPGFLPKS